MNVNEINEETRQDTVDAKEVFKEGSEVQAAVGMIGRPPSSALAGKRALT